MLTPPAKKMDHLLNQGMSEILSIGRKLLTGPRKILSPRKPRPAQGIYCRGFRKGRP